MYKAFLMGALGVGVAVFIGIFFTDVLGPLVDVMQAGQHSDTQEAQQVIGFFDALTRNVLVIVFTLAVGIYLFGRASAEGRLR